MEHTVPTLADARSVGLAASVPVAFVGLTKLVGAVTGVPYATLAKTHYTPGAPMGPVVELFVLGLLVTVPALVVTCQVVVQKSVARALDGHGDRAVVLTTLAAGFMVTSTTTGGLATAPELGKLVAAATLVLLIAVAAYALERLDRDPSKHLASAAMGLFGALFVLGAIPEVDSLAGGLYAVTPLAVVGVAALGYDRSGSLLVPALAYLVVSLAEFVILLNEAGLGPW